VRLFLYALIEMKEDMMEVGSRAQVMHGKAKRTSGGLTKKDLKYNKRGGIVSRKKSRTMKRGGAWKKRFGDKIATPFKPSKKTRKAPSKSSKTKKN